MGYSLIVNDFQTKTREIKKKHKYEKMSFHIRILKYIFLQVSLYRRNYCVNKTIYQQI